VPHCSICDDSADPRCHRADHPPVTHSLPVGTIEHSGTSVYIAVDYHPFGWVPMPRVQVPFWCPTPFLLQGYRVYQHPFWLHTPATGATVAAYPRTRFPGWTDPATTRHAAGTTWTWLPGGWGLLPSSPPTNYR